MLLLAAVVVAVTSCGASASYSGDYEHICHSTKKALRPVLARLVGTSITSGARNELLQSEGGVRLTSRASAFGTAPGLAARELGLLLEQKVRIERAAARALTAAGATRKSPDRLAELLSVHEKKLTDETGSAREWISASQAATLNAASVEVADARRAGIALDEAETEHEHERQLAHSTSLKCVLP